ncbi:hypothetical protein NOR51B_629 [Luminiphilus syltensis NOR5-1B]|uniref:DUF306 domain-containing protein n=1 Tax=Luminiphilus syltensis NOR5-1B TaxID=565045 RepID=B8KS39_9GAMM|nr:hypothetical protein NOR51B_629 [Luminiphilus syltensis NOR5-1B]
MRRSVAIGAALLALSPMANADNVTAEEVVPGLWEYTGLISSSGVDMPLTGIFLFADGTFLQHAIFNGEPFAEQGSMAHSGPYVGSEVGIELTAEQTLSLNPSADKPLTSMGVTTHDLTVERNGDDMTLVFSAGEGTVQTLSLLGPADAVSVYTLENGKLAFTGDHFLLVSGDESGMVSGYGTYSKVGDDYSLMLTRWSQSNGQTAENLRDTAMEVQFDGSKLTLPNGLNLAVIQ